MLSAFCKSMRGGDSTAALFWFARMTYAGVDPRIIVRRMIAHASEDVGLANPAALSPVRGGGAGVGMERHAGGTFKYRASDHLSVVNHPNRIRRCSR